MTGFTASIQIHRTFEQTDVVGNDGKYVTLTHVHTHDTYTTHTRARARRRMHVQPSVFYLARVSAVRITDHRALRPHNGSLVACYFNERHVAEPTQQHMTKVLDAEKNVNNHLCRQMHAQCAMQCHAMSYSSVYTLAPHTDRCARNKG